MTIAPNLELANALGPIRRNSELDSNDTDANNLQSQKHLDPITRTLRGMRIEVRAQSANAFALISRNWDPNSNDTVKKNSHHRKHIRPRISTLRGMAID
jgi:hypothetical protein